MPAGMRSAFDISAAPAQASGLCSAPQPKLDWRPTPGALVDADSPSPTARATPSSLIFVAPPGSWESTPAPIVITTRQYQIDQEQYRREENSS